MSWVPGVLHTGCAVTSAEHLVPESIKEEVRNVFNDITEKAGGQPIHGAVLDESSEEPIQHSQ
jgi:hypothetical protein